MSFIIKWAIKIFCDWFKKKVTKGDDNGTLADDKAVDLFERNVYRWLDYAGDKNDKLLATTIMHTIIDAAEYGAEFVKSDVYQQVLEILKKNNEN